MGKPWSNKETPLTDKAFADNKYQEAGDLIDDLSKLSRDFEQRLQATEEILKLTVDCIPLPPQIAFIITTYLSAVEGE